MEASSIIFYILAACAAVFSIMAVTSTKILRSATYLLFVLIATAGFYMLLNYHFIAAVQVSVYAGGIVVLYVFAILLTSAKGDQIEQGDKKKRWFGAGAAALGLGLLAYVLKSTVFQTINPATPEGEINMKVIGRALMGGERYQYVLPFEVLSVLLLACIVGGILIARKR